MQPRHRKAHQHEGWHDKADENGDEADDNRKGALPAVESDAVRLARAL